MALAQMTIQQRDQPVRFVSLRRLPGDQRFGLDVTTADGGAYQTAFTITRVSDPEVMRKLSARLRRRPTQFSITVTGKSYAVRSTRIAGSDHIRLHLSNDSVIIVDPGDDNSYAALTAAPAILFGVVAVAIAVSVAITVTSEDGSSDIEGEGGEGEGSDNSGGGEDNRK
jgi:hypothetical protein